MSVLKSKRNESKAEFVNNAYLIYKETLNFLARLSARYSRLMAPGVMNDTQTLLHCVVAANSVRPVDELRYNLRRENLMKARMAVESLDVQLSIVYELLDQNPCGAFSIPDKGTVPIDKAKKRLYAMSASLGEKIDKQNALIAGVIKSDDASFKK